jgi:hypothetical protein
VKVHLDLAKGSPAESGQGSEVFSIALVDRKE